MDTTIIIVGILAAAGIVLAVVLFMGAGRGRRRMEDVPPAMRPAYSDDQLERSVLERYMAWGVILTLFAAVFIPLYWLREPTRQTQAAEDAFVTSVVRGGELYRENCALCHGTDGGGGAAPSPYSDAAWPAPNLRDMVVRYEGNEGVLDIERFISQTIHQGRPGTPMPPWGAEFRGPLTDDQVDAITRWILDNQDDDEVAEADPAVGMSGGELYTENCARCHGEELEGRETVLAPSLNDVLQRHDEATILGILRNGIIVPTGTSMPAWQEAGYQTHRFTDEALQEIIDFLAASQDADADADADAEDEDADAEDADEADENDEDDDATEA